MRWRAFQPPVALFLLSQAFMPVVSLFSRLRHISCGGCKPLESKIPAKKGCLILLNRVRMTSSDKPGRFASVKHINYWDPHSGRAGMCFSLDFAVQGNPAKFVFSRDS